MAIKAAAGQTHLVLRNAGRGAANPPIHFADTINDQSSFSYALWVKATTNIPSNVTHIFGTDGSMLQIFYDGNQWRLRVRCLGIEFDQLYIGPATISAWSLIIFIVNGPFIDIWFGTEQNNDPESYVATTQTIHQAYPYNFTLDYIGIAPQSGISMCNFKYWNTILTIGGYRDQMHSWDTVVGGEPAPIWVSTLRTPGDISNVQYPYTSPDWNAGHAFSEISDPANLVFDGNDPAYMAKYAPCPTWLYPKDPAAASYVNPINTPLNPIIYPAPQFWQFDDRGSVPLTSAFQSIRYYGYPYNFEPSKPGKANTYPLYRDEHGVDVSDQTQTFEVNTGVTPPAAVVASNFLDWVYGAQFQYLPATPQQPASAGVLGYLHLYVKYVGYPTGVGIPHVPGVPPLPPKPPDPEVPPVEPPKPTDPPIPPPQPNPVAMSGLFAISKGQMTDKYSDTIELKIPDPTIRTAYIGE